MSQPEHVSRTRPRWRLGVPGCLAVAGGATVSTLVIMGILVWFLAPPYVERLVLAEARRYGVEISFQTFELSLRQATLSEVDFRLVGVRGLAGKIDRLEVLFQGLSLGQAQAEGVQIEAVGSAPALLLEIAEWTRTYAPAYRSRAAAHDVALSWREQPKGKLWLTALKGELLPAGDGGRFTASRATVAGVNVGSIDAGWSADEARVELGFGATEAEAAPLRLVVRHRGPNPEAEVLLRPTPLQRLSHPLGVSLASPGVTASGSAHLRLPPTLEAGVVEGACEFTLKGYVPPHPVELNGFVFGDETRVATEFSVSVDRQQIALTNTQVTAGRFKLAGQGQIERHDTHAQVQLALRGDLPCSALADAAAQSRLGQAMGHIVGGVARRIVDGTVAVLVKIDADTRDLGRAKMIRTIGVGCGLRPIPLPGIGRLDLDDLSLGSLAAHPPALPLPALPSAPPALPFPVRVEREPDRSDSRQ